MERAGTRPRRSKLFSTQISTPNEMFLSTPSASPSRTPTTFYIPYRLIPNPCIGDWQDQCLQPALIAPALTSTLPPSPNFVSGHRQCNSPPAPHNAIPTHFPFPSPPNPPPQSQTSKPHPKPRSRFNHHTSLTCLTWSPSVFAPVRARKWRDPTSTPSPSK